MPDLTAKTEKGPIRWLVLFFQALSAVTLFALMLVTCVDVVGRYVFNSPLTGSTELTEMAVGIVVFSVLPIVSWRNEHVVVDLLDNFVSDRVHMLRTFILNIIISIALSVLGYRIWVLGVRSLSYEEVSEYLEIPMGWMICFIAIMCWVTALSVVTVGCYRAYRFHQQAIEL